MRPPDVLELAEATGLRTVAEGIERPEQAEALRLLGCDKGQGYVWSRPVPLEELPAALLPRARAAARRAVSATSTRRSRPG